LRKPSLITITKEGLRGILANPCLLQGSLACQCYIRLFVISRKIPIELLLWFMMNKMEKWALFSIHQKSWILAVACAFGELGYYKGMPEKFQINLSLLGWFRCAFYKLNPFMHGSWYCIHYIVYNNELLTDSHCPLSSEFLVAVVQGYARKCQELLWTQFDLIAVLSSMLYTTETLQLPKFLTLAYPINAADKTNKRIHITTKCVCVLYTYT